MQLPSKAKIYDRKGRFYFRKLMALGTDTLQFLRFINPNNYNQNKKKFVFFRFSDKSRNQSIGI